MSLTTTTNPATVAAVQVLQDYNLHHSGTPENPQTAPPPNDRNAEEETSDVNPSWWPTDHNRVPPHRPINHNLDRDQRPGGLDPVEQMFIFTLLHGVGINAVWVDPLDDF